MRKFYITTPIYYVNDVPHIGHAYTSIAADTLARYKKLYGYDVFFLTGTDEHGQKVEKSAKEKGVTAKELADTVVERYKSLWKKLDIRYDNFIRTTDKQHYKAVVEIFKKSYDNGDIYKDKYEDWYCVPCETFLTDLQLDKGNCPSCARAVEKVSEDTYFFKLSSFQERLLNHIEQNPGFIKPESRKNEIVSFIKSGLRDISISRASIDWGIPLPVDNNHTIYVWFDALTNYLSGIGYPDNIDAVNRLWPADVHIVGKDILRFHAVYWPAFLMSAGMELPTTLYSHGWWTIEGKKMSKSKNNAVDPAGLVDTYSIDALRYFLLREIPFGQDGDFSISAFINRNNHDLANDLGNLVNRVLVMIEKYFGASLPAMELSTPDELDLLIRESANSLEVTVEQRLDNLDFMGILKDVWKLVVNLNGYIEKNAPWKLARNMEQNSKRLATVFYHLLEGIRVTAIYLSPVMPGSAARILNQIGIAGGPFTILDNAGFSTFTQYGEIKRDGVIFPKFDAEAADRDNSLDRAGKAVNAKITGNSIKNQKGNNQLDSEIQNQPEKIEEKIEYDDFTKVSLVTAEIISAERVPKSNKLLKLQVSLGESQRQIVAGIGKQYDPESLVGKSIIVVENLKPVKLMGVESNGMLLAAGSGKQLSLLTTMEELPGGSKIK